ncbi:MAG: TrfB-related DNA-binding protein [Gammaproteobacteria bacterium]|nr:TrfB-related DNA-binding protein [Gammaproteobacteria bacterium]
MKKTQFDILAGKTKLKKRALRLAEMVLVDGMTATVAGKKEGVTRQLAEQAVNRILRELKRQGKCPQEWRVITTVLPEHMAQVMEWIESKEREAAGLTLESKPYTPDLEPRDVELITRMIGEWRKKK